MFSNYNCAVYKRTMLKAFVTAFFIAVITTFAMSFAKADSATVLETSTTEASDGCVLLGLDGTYYTDAQAALDRLNEIRYEACVEGVPNPNDSSKALTVDDYVPLQWSSSLEKIARIRAAEASLTIAHSRLNGKSIFTISYDGLTSVCEDLAWNFNKTMVSGVEQFYDEKQDWLDVCAGTVSSSSVVTGHYTSIINPNYKYVGLGDFYNKNNKYPNSVALAMSKTTSALDTTMLSGAENIIQKLDVATSYIDSYSFDNDTHLGNGSSLQLVLKATITYSSRETAMYYLDDVTYKSSDTGIATVDSDGLVTGIADGEVTISAYSGSTLLTSFTLEVGCNHQYDDGTVSGSTLTYTCTICSATKSVTVPKKGATIYFKNSTESGTTYSSDVPTSNPVGSSILCWTYGMTADSGYDKILITCSDTSVLSVPDYVCTGDTAECTILKAGVVTLTFKAEYNPTAVWSYTITVGDEGTADISEAEVTLAYTSIAYTGKTFSPGTTVYHNGVLLTKGTHYTVEYSNNTEMGTATVTITGKGIYTGTLTTTFEIVGKAITKYGTVTLGTKSYEYDGTAKTPTVTVKYNGTTLTEGTDYTVSYENNIEIGTATVKVNGINTYSGTMTGTFTIVHTSHTYGTATVYKAATCEEAGEKRQTCLYCDKYTSTTIAATGHDYKEAYSWSDDYKTCTATLTCNNDSTHVQTVNLEIKSETSTGTGCDSAGKITYTATGTYNGISLSSTKTNSVSAIGHSYTSVVTAPTCTTKGYTTYTCSRCGENYTSDETAALGHSYTSVVTAPTCTTKGYTTYTCSRCGNSYTGAETAALGHSYTSVVTAPTCTTKGYTTYTCSRCGNSYTGAETAALGHSYTSVVTAPTCTTKGYTTYTCSRCGNSYTGDSTAAIGHSYTSVVTAATCTAKGYTTYTCSRCGNSYTGAETAALGHSYTSVVTAATCTAKGYTTYTCSRCGENYTSDETAVTGHTVVTDKEQTATCTTAGLTAESHCSVCGEIISTQKEVAALGHDYVETVTAPTCTDKGYTTHACTRCDSAYTDNYVETISHTYTSKITKTATYTAAGVRTYTCSACGTSYTEAIAKLTLAKPTVTLTNAAKGVKISWNKVNGASGYYIYRKTSGGTFKQVKKITSASATYYIDTTAKAGTTYYYTVKAYTGTATSSYVTNKTIKYLKQPTVSLSNVSTGIKVNWSKTTGASGYYIYRKAAGGTFTQIKKITSGSTTSFIDTTAKAGTTYYYTVKAYSGSFVSTYVTNKTIKVLKQPTVTLSNTTKGIKVAWSKATGASGYYIYRKTAGGSWSKIKQITSGSTVSYIDTTAKSGKTYYYTVRAYSGSTMSSYLTNKSIKKK